nr:hypothetical protein [uncultured Flavobacterium sp.]
MSRYFYIFSAIFFLYFNLSAQPGIGSARSLIKLEFKDIYGLQISHPKVSLEINSIEKFKNGTETPWLNSHLIVTGVQNFEIGIRSTQTNFLNNSEETNISVTNIQVLANLNSKSNSIILKNKTQVLINENNGSIINHINVKYRIPLENTDVFLNHINKTFDTIILYTLIPF